jgi:very-short-patch-repair endonuclease
MQQRLHGGGAMRATGKSMRLTRQQRRAMSPPEVRLWNRLRRSPAGIRFRKQHAIGPYVADFYCPSTKLVIEVDGQIHEFAEAVAHDSHRDDYMRRLGLEIIRISAKDKFVDVDAVADGLIAMCSAQTGPSTTQLR